MAVLHHPGAHSRGGLRVSATTGAFVLGFLLALPGTLFLATDVLAPMLPLGEQVVGGPAARTMAVLMALGTGLAAAVCAAARRTRDR